MSESELLWERWRSGDEQAGARLLREWIPLLRRFFNARCPQDTDELTQQTVVSLFRCRDGVQPIASLRGYVLRCARNRLIDHRRAAERHAIEALPSSSLMDSASGPSRQLRRDDLAQAVNDCMGSLSELLRLPLELHYWEGFRLEEIAEVLEVPVGTAKSRLRLARAKFARTFAARYGHEADFL